MNLLFIIQLQSMSPPFKICQVSLARASIKKIIGCSSTPVLYWNSPCQYFFTFPYKSCLKTFFSCQNNSKKYVSTGYLPEFSEITAYNIFVHAGLIWIWNGWEEIWEWVGRNLCLLTHVVNPTQLKNQGSVRPCCKLLLQRCSNWASFGQQHESLTAIQPRWRCDWDAIM